MSVHNPTDELLLLIQKWSLKGKKKLSTGVLLVCPTPHLGPEAWLHVVFPPLSTNKIAELEKNLRRSLPNDFRLFLKFANGLMLFNYRLSVWGYRKKLVRLGGDETWFPHDLIDQNTDSNRPEGSPEELIFFASADDGDNWCFFECDGSNYRVGKCSRHKFQPSSYWPDFGTWLIDEMKSLAANFDLESRS